MIDNVALRLQRRETERLLNTISRFGYKNLKPTKTLMKVWSILLSLICRTTNWNISQSERFSLNRNWRILRFVLIHLRTVSKKKYSNNSLVSIETMRSFITSFQGLGWLMLMGYRHCWRSPKTVHLLDWSSLKWQIRKIKEKFRWKFLGDCSSKDTMRIWRPW